MSSHADGLPSSSILFKFVVLSIVMWWLWIFLSSDQLQFELVLLLFPPASHELSGTVVLWSSDLSHVTTASWHFKDITFPSIVQNSCSSRLQRPKSHDQHSKFNIFKADMYIWLPATLIRGVVTFTRDPSSFRSCPTVRTSAMPGLVDQIRKSGS